MRAVASTLIALSAVAGIGGAVFAYQSAATPDEVLTRSVSDEPDPTPSTEVRYLPCKAGTTLRGETCVREVEKVVVRDVPAPAPAPAPRAPVRSATRSSDDAVPSPRPTPSVREDDEREDHVADEHESEHGEEYESEHDDEHESEHGDEHHGDDD